MKNKIKNIFEKIKNAFKSKTDPDGSYTGNAETATNPLRTPTTCNAKLNKTK